MSTPIQEQILDAIEDRLKLVTTSNEYSFSVLPTSIRRKDRTVWNLDTDLPTINYWPGTDERLEGTAGWESRVLRAFVEIWSSDYDEDPPDLAFKLSSQVWVALLRTATNPKVSDDARPALNGLVTAMELSAIAYIPHEGERPLAGALMELAITYYLDPSDPFTIIP